MIKLAVEIPTSRLKQWSPLVDLDFVLAHTCLKDPHYAEFFLHRPPSRKVILDNSTHEFGRPLPFENLRRAADMCNANVVIAPDIVNPTIDYKQYIQNIEWIRQAGAHLDGYEIGAVMCGKGEQERYRWLDKASKTVNMLCFSFHIPERLRWWKDFVTSTYFHEFVDIHLLGMMSMMELRQWVKIAQANPQKNFSFDTCKPLKLGVQGLRFTDSKSEGQTLRGGAINSKAILEMRDFTEEQEICIMENLDYLRAVCRGEV